MKSITTDLNIIQNSIKKSNLIELSEDGEKVRRKKPLPEDDDSDPRTIYIVKRKELVILFYY